MTMTRTHRIHYEVPGERNERPYRVRQEFVSADGSRMLIQDWWPSGYARGSNPYTTRNTALHVESGLSHTWRGNAEPWPDAEGPAIASQLWDVAARLGGLPCE